MGARGCGKEGEGNGAGLGGDRWWGQVWGEGRRGGGGACSFIPCQQVDEVVGSCL